MVRADQTPLTDKYPRLEHSWKVPCLNGGEADSIAEVENTYD